MAGVDYIFRSMGVSPMFLFLFLSFPLPDRVEDKLRGNDTVGIQHLVKNAKVYLRE